MDHKQYETPKPVFKNSNHAYNYYKLGIQSISKDIEALESKLVYLKKKRAEYRLNLNHNNKNRIMESYDTPENVTTMDLSKWGGDDV